MFCKFCGNSIDDDSIFCSLCGRKIKDTTGNEEPAGTNEPSSVVEKNPVKENDTDYEPNPYLEKFGFLLLLIFLVAFFVMRYAHFDDEESYNRIRFILTAVFVIIRIFVVWLVVQAASEQKRNQVGWGIFAFIFPAISLITLSNLQKFK